MVDQKRLERAEKILLDHIHLMMDLGLEETASIKNPDAEELLKHIFDKNKIHQVLIKTKMFRNKYVRV